MARFGGHIRVSALLSAAFPFSTGVDEIGHRLRTMRQAQRNDPPDDSARALHRREKNLKLQGSQVKTKGRRH